MKTTKRTTRTETTRNESTLTEVVVEEGYGSAASREGRSMEHAHAHELPHRAVKVPVTRWHHLQTFFIEYPPRAGGEAVPQVKVFANGRQQVRVRVVLSPRDTNGEFVAVPVSELKALVNLIDYNTGDFLPTGWTAHWEPNEYTYADWAISNAPGKSSGDYVPHDNRPGSNEALAEDQIAVEYYVTASNVDSLRIAASVIPSQATQPIQTRPGASGNQFDSSVTVDARPPLNLGAESFTSRESGRGEMHGWVATNHHVGLVYQGSRINLLRVKPMTSEERLNIYIDNGEYDSWEAVFTICQMEYDTSGWAFSAAYVPTTLRMGEHTSADISYFFQNPPISGQSKGEVLYVRHMSKFNYHFYWGDEDAGEVIQQPVYIVDEFGNDHKVIVGAKSRDSYQHFIGVVGNW